MSRPPFFYLVAAGVAAGVVALGGLPPYVVWPVIIWYGASLILDLYGTLRAGPGAISRREVSIPFRMVTARAGLAAAVAAQVALEVCLALAAAPLILGHDVLYMPAVAAFCGAAAVSHTYGFVSNCARTPR